MPHNKEFACVLPAGHEKNKKLKNAKVHDYGYVGKGHPAPKTAPIVIPKKLRDSPIVASKENNLLLALTAKVSDYANQISNLEKNNQKVIDAKNKALATSKKLKEENSSLAGQLKDALKEVEKLKHG